MLDVLEERVADLKARARLQEIPLQMQVNVKEKRKIVQGIIHQRLYMWNPDFFSDHVQILHIE